MVAETGLVGGGGCAAHALAECGVFATADEAKAELNALIPIFLAKRVGATGDPSYPRELVGVDDDLWHIEVIGEAIRLQGWHFRKVPAASSATATALTCGPGTFFVDGTLNKHWQMGICEMLNDESDESDPAQQPGAWRHAVAVVDGQVREQQGQRIDARWLWLDRADGSADPAKGYMRELLRVYRVGPCSGAAGCKGTCMTHA